MDATALAKNAVGLGMQTVARKVPFPPSSTLFHQTRFSDFSAVKISLASATAVPLRTSSMI
jgi:hypothetical protein